MKKIYNYILSCLILTTLLSSCSSGGGDATTDESAVNEERKKFTVAWSIYAGWQPWDYANQSGILKKWADKHNIDIELVRMDYIASIEAYVAGQADACVMTNMEALDMPAASGVTSSAIIVGDYSNGNDAIITRDGLGVEDLAGQNVYLVELSVSHYLLSRALESKGLSENDVTVVNTSDSDIAPAFLANDEQKAVVTWNPLVMEILATEGMTDIANSSMIPGEVLDMMVANTKTLEESPELGKALAGAWYEVMDVMQADNEETGKALAIMAESAGCSVDDYKAQLSTTAMFYKAQDAVDYISSDEAVTKMDYVRNFCFSHGLLGENASSVDLVGIKHANGTIQGDSANIQLIFDASYMQGAVKSAM